MYYKLYQNENSKNLNMYHKWYARAVVTCVKTIDDVAEVMQQNCTVKKSDIKAVLNELPDVLKLMFEAGYRVVLEGLGSFKVGLISTGVSEIQEFDVKKNITGMRLIFQPESELDATTGKRTKSLLRNLTKRNITTLGSASEVAAREAAKAEAAGNSTPDGGGSDDNATTDNNGSTQEP